MLPIIWLTIQWYDVFPHSLSDVQDDFTGCVMPHPYVQPNPWSEKGKDPRPAETKKKIPSCGDHLSNRSSGSSSNHFSKACSWKEIVIETPKDGWHVFWDWHLGEFRFVVGGTINYSNLLGWVAKNLEPLDLSYLNISQWQSDQHLRHRLVQQRRCFVVVFLVLVHQTNVPKVLVAEKLQWKHQIIRLA